MRYRSLLFMTLIAALVVLAGPRVALADEGPTLAEARAACLMDAYGNVLYEENADQEMALASITKIMTAMVALDSDVSLDDRITFQVREYQDDAQLTGYTEGETPTFRELMEVMLVFSGNDAASNVAFAVAGTEEAFADLMNAKAQEIGMEHTHFVNPHGLEAEGQYSCARDLCLMGRYALEHYPFIRDTITTRNLKVVVGGATLSLDSTDHLMDTYEGLRGIKTGHTESGYSFLGAARRDHVTLYSCVLCCDSGEQRFADSATLLDWGFSQYAGRQLARSAWQVRSAPWQDGFWLRCPVTPLADVSGKQLLGSGLGFKTVMYKPNTFVGAGDAYGMAVWSQGERRVGSVAYGTDEPQHTSAWNPFVQQLFDQREGLTA